MAANDLALLAHRSDRRSYLHEPFRLESGGAALVAVGAAATTARNAACSKKRAPGSAPTNNSSGGRSSPGPNGPSRRPTEPGPSGRRALAVGVPGGEDAGPAGLDRHREFEVRGQGAILGEDRPVVVAHPHR